MSLGPRLIGKVAVVSGGSSGMGRATVDLFVEHGARVVVIDRQPPLRTLPAGVLFHQGSVTSAEDWSTVLALAEKEFGVATILVNCAGVLSEKKTLNMTDNEWERVMAVNSTGVFYGMRALIKTLVEKKLKGSIVNISSMAGIRTMGLGSGIAYEASKASCCHMTRVVARDHGPDGIRANCVLPGFTLTEMVVVGTGRDTAYYESMTGVDHLPLGRWSTPQEVASCVLFLASDDSSYVTGLNLVHDENPETILVVGDSSSPSLRRVQPKTPSWMYHPLLRGEPGSAVLVERRRGR